MVLSLVFVLYQVLVFSIPRPETDTFWIGWGFFVLAFALMCGQIMLAAWRNPTEEKVFFAAPSLWFGLVYLGLQLILSFLLTFLPIFSITFAWTSEIVLLLVALIVVGVTLFAKETVMAKEQNIKQKRLFVQWLAADLHDMLPSVKTAAVEKALRKLEEAVRYSDPMSSPVLEPMEQELQRAVYDLRNLLAGGEEADCLAQLQRMTQQLADRNRRCILLK